jgi:hypothetical protein
MRGLLPDHVLAPRAQRTGVTTAYSDRRMRESFPELLGRYFKDPILADLGLVEPHKVRLAWAEYCRTGNLALKIPLFLTLQAELWLRARLDRKAPAQSRVPERAFVASG